MSRVTQVRTQVRFDDGRFTEQTFNGVLNMGAGDTIMITLHFRDASGLLIDMNPTVPVPKIVPEPPQTTETVPVLPAISTRRRRSL